MFTLLFTLLEEVAECDVTKTTPDDEIARGDKESVSRVPDSVR